MEFVPIPAGEFMMGYDESVEDLSKAFERGTFCFEHSTPSHRVIITKPFYLGKYEVTVGEFKRFVESTHYVTVAEKVDSMGGAGYSEFRFLGCGKRFNWKRPGWEQIDAHPVGNVGWNDAVAFCQWLSKTEQREYRLPTEAEWEYACRAGSKTRYSFGNDPEELAQYGNVADGTALDSHPEFFLTDRKKGVGYGKRLAIKVKDGHVFTAPVGSFRPNAWGLYDMYGNVGEWCSDWYNEEKENYYATSEIEDPQGAAPPMTTPPAERAKVTRGGSWVSDPVSCLTANRGAGGILESLGSSCEGGFRVVVTTDPAVPSKDKTDP